MVGDALGGRGRLCLVLLMTHSCGDTECVCSMQSAPVSTGPTCSVSSALVTTVSGVLQGTRRMVGNSIL